MEKGKIGPRLEDINLKIEEEYNRFTEHFLFITKYVLTSCFERLYNLFKLDREKRGLSGIPNRLNGQNH